MKKDKLTDEAYWANAWTNLNVDGSEILLDKNDPIRKWIEGSGIQLNGEAECFEVGCFPGQFLTIFGNMGCKLNGIDLVKEVETVTPATLNKLGYKTGLFRQIDFFDYIKNGKDKFDLVSSFGLIEHFINWEEVILMHAGLVKPGGYLILETPNFRSMPHYLIRLMLDKKNLDYHNLKAMNPDKWKTILEAAKFDVISYGGIGKFHFWAHNPDMNKMQWLIKKVLQKLKPQLTKLLPGNSKTFSPYYGIIAKKR